MTLWRKRPKLDRGASLRAIPVHNPAASFEKDDRGLVQVSLPRRDVRWVRVLAKVFALPERKRFSLDELGSFVWERCDGKTPVKQVIGELAKRYNLGRKEAEMSTANYMKLLVKKGLIGVKVRRADKP